MTKNDPMIPELYRIQHKCRENDDTFTLDLEPTNGTTVRFAAGQFNMLYVFGVGQVPISISGDAAQQQQIAHTTRAVGAVTSAMSKLRAGDALGVRGPYGVGWPVNEAVGQDVALAHNGHNLLDGATPGVLGMHHDGQAGGIGRFPCPMQGQHARLLAGDTVFGQPHFHAQNHITVLLDHGAGLVNIGIFGK